MAEPRPAPQVAQVAQATPAPGPLPLSARDRVSLALADARWRFLGNCIAGYGTLTALVKLVEQFHRHGHTIADVWSTHFAGHLVSAAVSAVCSGLIMGAITWRSHKKTLRERLEADERFRLALMKAGREGLRE